MSTVSTFVNENKANVAFKVANGRNVNIDALEAKFAATVQHDKVVDEAFPVIAYELNNKLVAWYDMELFAGYISR